MATGKVQEAIAFLQKTSTTDNTSLYEQLTNLVIKVPSSWQLGGRACTHVLSAGLNKTTYDCDRCLRRSRIIQSMC